MKKIYKQISLSVLSFMSLGVSYLSAQAPGGIATNLAGWYKANDGASATTWLDKSGQGNDLSGVNSPSVSINTMNFQPVVTLRNDPSIGTENLYQRYAAASTAATWPGTTDGNTYYFITKPRTVGDYRMLLSKGNGIESYNSSLTGAYNNTGSVFVNGGYYYYLTVPNTWAPGKVVMGRTGNASGATPQHYVSFSGATEITAANAYSPSYGATEKFRIGVRSDDAYHWDGDIAEVIVYKGKQTPTEYQKVESYLALKYGIHKEGDYKNSTGSTVWSTATNTGYTNNVYGLIEDGVNLKIKQSQSLNNTAITLFVGTLAATNDANATALTPNTSLLLGDNGIEGLDPYVYASGSVFQNASTTQEVKQIGKKIWKAQVSGLFGTTNMKISSASAKYVLVSASNGFSPATTRIYPIVAGVASNVAVADGEFVTMAYYAKAPGGVSVGDLSFWYKANDITGLADGTKVSAWDDSSFNGYGKISQTDVTLQPKYYSSTASKLVNFNPTVYFADASTYTYLTNPKRFMPTGSAYSFFGAYRDEEGTYGIPCTFSASNQCDVFDFQGYVSGYGYLLEKAGVYWLTNTTSNNVNDIAANKYGPFGRTYNGSGYTNTTFIQPQTYGITDAAWANVSPVGLQTTSYFDGYKTVNTSASDGAYRQYYFSEFRLGWGHCDTAEYWKGPNQESIAYSKQLTDTEAQKVNTYLALKYGTTLGQGGTGAATNQGRNHNNMDYISASGVKVWDTALQPTFNANIAGIIRDDLSDLIQKQSVSQNANQTSPITIGLETIAATNAANTSVFDTDVEAVVWADNNAVGWADAPASACFVPENLGSMTNRRWKITETGDVQNLKMSVPLSMFTGNVSTDSDLYLMIADDTGIIDKRVTKIGKKVGANVEFDFNIPANTTKYFAFGGLNTTVACVTCTGDTQTVSPAKAYGGGCSVAIQNTNTVTGYAATGGDADILVDFKTTFPAGVTEYGANCWPRQYGDFLELIRYDNKTGAPSEVVFESKFNKATKPSFDIAGIDNYVRQQDEIIIVGYCGTSIVANAAKTSLLYPASDSYGTTYGTVAAVPGGGEGKTNYEFWGSPYWKYATLHVEFTKPVDRFEIKWTEKNRGYAFDYYQYLYIGNMNLDCPWIPSCFNTDEVYVDLSTDKKSYNMCDIGRMTLKVKNRSCYDYKVDLSTALPAGLTYVAASLNADAIGVANFGTDNAYGDSQNLNLSNYTLKPGEYNITVEFKASAPVSNANIQTNFTVKNNGTLATTSTGQSDAASAAGCNPAVINYVATSITPIPSVKLTADKPARTCGPIKYTVTFNNATGSVANNMIFRTNLDPFQELVAGSITNAFGGTVVETSYGGKANFQILNMSVPTGITSFTFDVDSKSNSDDGESYVELEKDPSIDPCAFSNKKYSYYPEKCPTCEGGKGKLTTNLAWYNAGQAGRDDNKITNVAVGNPNSGAIKADVEVVYPNATTEWYPTYFPRYYGGFAEISRYDDLNGAAGLVTYTMNLKDATGPISAKANFQIAGITNLSGQANKVRVVGYCGANEYDPKMTYANTYLANEYNRFTITNPNIATGTKPYYETYPYATANVEFTDEVDKIVIEWTVERSPVYKTLNMLYIGDVNYLCSNPKEITPDNVEMLSAFVQDTLPTSLDGTIKMVLKNRNCVNKTLNISNTLPSDLQYVANSYAGIGAEAPTYANQSFSLNGLVVPPGNSYLYIKVKPSNPTVSGTYTTKFNYTVVGGINNPNPYRSDDQGSSMGYQDSSITYNSVPVPVKPVITKTVDKCFKTSGDGTGTELTYTITVNNSANPSAVSNVEFLENLGGDQKFVASSLQMTGFTGGTVSPYATDERFMNITGLTIPASATATLVYKVKTNSTSADVDNQVSFTPNPASLDALANRADSNMLLVKYCTFCTKPGSTTPATNFTKLGVSTKQGQNIGWPENVPNGFLVVESGDKGMVITRAKSADIPAAELKEGMVIFDTTDKCLKLYNGTVWNCVNRSCND